MRDEHRNREYIFVEVSEERSAQDAQWGGEPHDDGHAPLEWMGFVERQAMGARMALADKPEEDHYGTVRKRLIKIAALAIAGIESIDRCVDAE